MSEKLEIIKFYGASWCADCHRAIRFLNENDVKFDITNIDEDMNAADEVTKINKGYKSIPTIVFSDNTILVEPSNQQLAEKLGL
jgi:glutaredoxin